jgi:hypothetical protein
MRQDPASKNSERGILRNRCEIVMEKIPVDDA